MAIEFGPHVIISGASAEIVGTFSIVSSVFADFGLVATITSITDRLHSRGSLHYAGKAYDILWMPEFAEKISPERLLKVLFLKINGFPQNTNIPPEFDILFEGDHFHIEHQPKVTPAVYTQLVRDWYGLVGSPNVS